MTITIDLRSLQKGIRSGVETYAYNVVLELLKQDSKNNYRLFYNSFGQVNTSDLQFVNVKNIKRNFPNKLLAFSSQFGWPSLQNLMGDSDIYWMPNLNHVSPKVSEKLALTVHDISFFTRPEFYDFRRSVWHKTANFEKMIRRAKVILAASEYTKADLIHNFSIPAGKICVTYEGVNRDAYKPDLEEMRLRQIRNIYELPGNFVLYLGTLEPRKNVAGLIKAFDGMRTDASLVLAGRPGWKYDEIYQAINKSKKKSRIKLLGFVEEADKPYLLKLARVFAFPSFYEGFGLPILEAMAVGTPVLTSSISSMSEIAGTAALLVNPSNIEEMSLALDQLLEEEKIRASLIEKGLSKVTEFSWKKTAGLTLEAFKKIGPT